MGPCVLDDIYVSRVMTPNSITKTRLQERHVRLQQLTNLADMVRERAGTRGDAIAYEFEGARQLSPNSTSRPTALRTRL
jgi:hypothetical protein